MTQRDLSHWPVSARLGRPWVGLVAATVGCSALTVGMVLTLDERRTLIAALLYLLLTLVAASAWGYIVGLATAVASNLLLNFFFVAPVRTFTVQEGANATALLLYLAVAIVGASMLSLLRRQLRQTEARRVEAEVMLDLSQVLARAASGADAAQGLCATATRALGASSSALLRRVGRGWDTVATSGTSRGLDDREQALALLAIQSGRPVRQPEGVRLRALRTLDADSALTIVPTGGEDPDAGVLVLAGVLQASPGVALDRLLSAFGDEGRVCLERIRLADEARRTEELKRADEFKSVLLASISHDLRTPLTAIRTAVDSLRDPNVAWSKPDVEGFLDSISSQTERLTYTVSSLLQMSRLEGGAIEATIEPIEVRALLHNVLATVDAALTGRAVHVECSAGLWTSGDYVLLTQALGNLVDNAGKHSTPAGAIWLRGRQANERVLIEVRDEGPGIPAVDLPHVFERFYRGGRTSGTTGSGLGLSIAKAMVELCGGTLTLESGASGTAFRIDLPALERSPVA